jgi:predicted AlkP superfamily phosphohydrolase/phosphomutase/tetratricopeptide (TPR) repeat protein
MSLTTAPLVVIAVDGLDWQLLQQLVDEGKMPFCQKLIENGASGRVNMPPPHASAALWSTVATGVLADQHGICHDLEIREDGLTVQSISHHALKSESFWHLALAAGKSVRVAGWPATIDSTISSNANNGSCIVSNGVEKAQPGGDIFWPLAPEVISPKSARDTIIELLVHPNDLDSNMVLPLLIKPCREAGLINVAAGLLSEIASMHNIGTIWAEKNDWDLLTLRFNFLPTWLASIQQRGIEINAALQPWYCYLDLMIGRYMALAGQNANFVIVSDHGLPAKQNTQADDLLGLKTAGSVVLCGPDIPSDKLLSHSSGLDICPTVLSLLGLAIPTSLKGKVFFVANNAASAAHDTESTSIPLADLINEVAIDSPSLFWLEQHGYLPVNLRPLMNMVNQVKAETMAGWAAVKYATGCRNEAIDALQQALILQPKNLSLKLSLANKFLESGRVEDCKLLVDGLPSVAKTGDWPDVIGSLIAFADKDLPMAEQHLLRLAQSKSCPINAYGWLGHIKLAQQQWREAIVNYESSFNGSGELSGYFEGLGKAHMQLNEFQQALSAFSNAIALQPFNARFLVNRAQAYEKNTQSELAQQDLWRALSIDPTLTQAHSQLAKLVTNLDTNKICNRITC